MKNLIFIALMMCTALTITNCTKEKIVEVQKANLILSGKEAPAPTVGNEGDYYLNTTTTELYGPKTATGWGTPISLKGAKGEPGAAGEAGAAGSKILSGEGAPTPDVGNEGDWYLDTHKKRFYGPKKATAWPVTYVSLDPEDDAPTPEPEITPADYELSTDGKTLLKWKNTTTKRLDMQANDQLKKVTAIANYAFEDIQMALIVLPDNLETIGDGAFKLKFISTEALFNDIILVIPDKVKHIGKEAFYYRGFKAFTIPNSIESLGEDAFAHNSMKTFTIPNKLTHIPAGVFGANRITSVTIPNYITTIGDMAFYSNKISSLTIPNSVVSIGNNAFFANELPTVSIPGNVKKIGDYVFHQNKLTSIVISEGVESIGREAFAENRLKTVTFPSTLKELGENVLDKNDYIQSITFEGAVPPTIANKSSFSFTTKNLYRIYVPAASVEAYKTAFPRYKDIIVAK